MLTYLDLQGISIVPDQGLDDLMVDLAAGKIDFRQLAEMLQAMDNE